MAKHVNFYTSTLNSNDTVQGSSNAEPGSIVIAKTSGNNPVARLFVKDPTGGADGELFEIGSNVSSITTKSATVNGNATITGTETVNGNTTLKGNLSVGGDSGLYATIKSTGISLKVTTSVTGDVSLATSDTSSSRKTVSIGDDGGIATFSSSTTGTASGIRLKQNTTVSGTLTTGTTVNIGSTSASVAKFESSKITFKQSTELKNTFKIGTSSNATYTAEFTSTKIDLNKPTTVTNTLSITGTTTTAETVNIGGSTPTVAQFTSSAISLKQPTTVSNTLNANKLNVGTNSTNNNIATFSTDSGVDVHGIHLKQEVDAENGLNVTGGNLTVGAVTNTVALNVGGGGSIATFNMDGGGYAGIQLNQSVNISSGKELTVPVIRTDAIYASNEDNNVFIHDNLISNSLIYTGNELAGNTLNVGVQDATRGTIATFDTNGIKLKSSTEVTNAFKVSGYVDAMGNAKFYNSYPPVSHSSTISNIPSGLYFLMISLWSSESGAFRSSCVIACPGTVGGGSKSIFCIKGSDSAYAESSFSASSRATISLGGLLGYTVTELVAYPLFIPCDNNGTEFDWA